MSEITAMLTRTNPLGTTLLLVGDDLLDSGSLVSSAEVGKDVFEKLLTFAENNQEVRVVISYADDSHLKLYDYANTVVEDEDGQPQTGITSETFVNQMVEAIRNNQIPQGFDIQNLPKEFIEDAHDYGVPAALRMYTLRNAEQIQAQTNAQQIADELAKRQRGTKPMSPSSPNPNFQREINYMDMSSEDFAKLDKKLMKAALEGKTIR